jgi:diguanylate cyclase (GGDEF)-like protein/PAS domain S-box-containing protein
VDHARALKALFVDVAPARADAVSAALAAAGWQIQAVRTRGPEELAGALLQRGWGAVFYGGDGESAVPTRKALALVRLADPHLPFIAISPHVHAGDLAALVRGFEHGVTLAHDIEGIPEILDAELAGRKTTDSGTHRLLLAQQAVTDLVAAGLAPEDLFARVLGTLGETLGFAYGAAWRPDGELAVLACDAVWHPADASPALLAFAQASQAATYAPGRGLLGRIWAFRRPTWVPDATTDPQFVRSDIARAAGLRTAVGFPLVVGDECLGVVEFFATDVRQPDSDLSALFATVGGQLAQYLVRWRLQAAESRRVEAMLRAERDRAQRYLDVAGCMIVVLDPEGRIELVNRKGCEVIGREENELAGADWIDVAIPEEHRAATRHIFSKLVSGELDQAEEFETTIVTAAGEVRMISWHTTLLFDPDGKVSGMLASGDDVTERRRNEQQIAYLAYHDPLTGLPNRTLLEEHLRLALARSRRTEAGVALLHIDLDNFKLVNDSLGHTAGDELLCRLATRLSERVRATDLLSRHGGDEFLLMLADLQEDPIEVAERVAGTIADALAEPFEVAGAEFQLTASIGISTAPRDADNAETLINNADTAMYQAKQVARGGWTVFAADRLDPLERLSLSARMRRALDANEFLLYYQPIFSLATNRLEGVEALIRWIDPEKGMVPPGDFIPVAEETGMIESIGDWVFRAVCEQQVIWAQKGFEPQISFNVSPRQLRRLDFAERVALHLSETGADPAKLTLELTESATLSDPAAAEPILQQIHDHGLRIALDDFGAGYSSLARLREMPVETVKIDRAFLREVPENREASAIVTAILHLSRALGRTAVAEGVETEAQRAFLAGEHCELAQGFLLARPLPAAEVEALMTLASLTPRAA